MPERYRIGNAQTIGCRDTQSNYFSFVNNRNGDLLAVLADGTIDHPNGRRGAIMAVEYCSNAFLCENAYSEQFLYETALSAGRCVQDLIFLDRTPRLSLTICLFTHRYLQCFNVGQNKVCIYNGRGEQVLSGDTAMRYYSGGLLLSPRDTVGIYSAGACAYVNPIERIEIITKVKKAYVKAGAIIESVNRKSPDSQMNATALLVEVLR